MKRGSSNLAILATVGAGYYLAARIGMAIAFDHPPAWPLWPPTGLAIGAMLLLGYRIWPAILSGASFAHLFSTVLAGASPISAALVSLAVGLADTLEVLAATWLTNRYAAGAEVFHHPKTIFRFVLVTGACALLVSPTLGLASLNLAGFSSSKVLGQIWVNWWSSHVVSTLALTPLVLAWPRLPLWKWTPRRVVEAAATLLLLLLFTATVAGYVDKDGSAPAAFLVIPVLLWAALRFGPPGATAAVFLLTCAATVATLHSQGPFALGTRAASLLSLQSFIAVMSVMVCTLAADVWQRNRTEMALAHSRHRYRELFNHNPEPIFICDAAQGVIIAVNDAALRTYGYASETLLQRSFSRLRLEPTREKQPPSDGTAETMVVCRDERHRRADGTVIEVQVVTYSLLFDDKPAAVRVCTDITPRKRAQLRATVFSDLGQRLNTAHTYREAFLIVMESADALFAWDACALELLSPLTGNLETSYQAVVKDGQRSEKTVCGGERSKLHWEVLAGGAQLAPRQTAHPTEQVRLLEGGENPQSSVMGVPIRRGEKVLGVLSVQSADPGRYSQEDLQTLQALADHCVGAIERIRAQEQIERLNRELRDHLEQLRTLLAVAPVAIAVAEDPDCRVVSGNEAWCTLLNFSNPLNFAGDQPADPWPFRIVKDGQTMAPPDFPMRRAVAEKRNLIGEEVELHLNDGRVVDCYAYASPLFADPGKVRGCLGILVDLSARKAAEREILRLNTVLERRVQERTVQLEASNRELEAFCYSVSHDLRAPLRSIRGFSEILLDRYSSLLDGRGREFLQRSLDSCVQMDRLIEDLLKLSRVSRSELQYQHVNLSHLADAIAQELKKGEPNRQVEVQIQPNLLAEGDERLLRVALDNLLQNAWKFTRHQPEARIEFGKSPQPENTFFVRDNGAGFNPAYGSKLFSVFQRLHSSSEFPGTGIGLATVQRIINRHGGRAWATGEVRQGACFYFTLPGNGISK